MSGYIFISYSKHDREYVTHLAEHLSRAGFEVWFDTATRVGEDWWTVIRDRVDACGVFVVVMSPHAEESRWVYREILRAEETRRPIVPLLLSGQPFSHLADLQAENVTDYRMPSVDFLDRLRGLLKLDPAQIQRRPPVAGEQLCLLPDTGGRRVWAGFSPRDDLLATFSRKHTERGFVDHVRIWSGAAFDTTTEFSNPKSEFGIACAGWATDGRCLAMSCYEHAAPKRVRSTEIALWSVPSGLVEFVDGHLELFGEDEMPSDISLSETHIAHSNARRVALVPLDRTASGRAVGRGSRRVAWSPDGTRFVSAGEPFAVGVFHAATGAQLTHIDVREPVSVAWAPTGGLVAGAVERQVAVWLADGGTLVRQLTGHASTVTDVAYSSNGVYMATGSADQTVRIWRASTGAQLSVLIGHTAPVFSVSWSVDGSMLASAGEDGVRVWTLSYDS